MLQFRKLVHLMLMCTPLLHAQVSTPFERGVNLSNWFQKGSIQQVDFSRYAYEDFVDLQTLGVDVVRLPINLHAMTGGAPDYIVDPILFNFLDQIIDWTEELNIHLILDNHTFSVTENTTVAVNTPLSIIWPQMAAHFIDRDSTLYFEILNEPHGIDDFVWNTVQQNIVNLIRQVDAERTLIVGPAGWNSYNNLDDMLNYNDDNLIYTFHFYDPFVFTHQGASWTDPSMVSLGGVPFPSNAGSIPACPPDLVGSWVQGNLVSYGSQGTVQHVQELLDIAVAFGESRGVPIYCGEFGVLNHNAIDAHRIEWYREVTAYLDAAHIGWTMWDYHGGFGLFEVGGTDLFDHDLNIPLVEAMGFNSPPQTDYVFTPDSTGFPIYQDYLSQNIHADFQTDGTLTMYAPEDPRYGNYSLYWTGAVQYDRVGFKFSPYKDLSHLVTQDYEITFWVKSSGTPQGFDLRFVDTKTDVPEDHPWRMGKTISEADLSWTGEWEYIRMPLSLMDEKGSYDGTYYPPQGLFDWTHVDLVELVSEHSSMAGSELWFDEIRIVDAGTASINQKSALPYSLSLDQNFPNPFNPTTSIRFRVPIPGDFTLSIFDVRGQHVTSLVNGVVESGSHEFIWDGRAATGMAVDSGIYFARLSSNFQTQSIKMLFLK